MDSCLDLDEIKKNVLLVLVTDLDCFLPLWAFLDLSGLFRLIT